MKKITIGIPKELYYNEHKVFIISFFEYLGYNIIISQKDNLEKTFIKRCTTYDNYLKSIFSIKKRCNYIIIPYENRPKSKEIACPFLTNTNTIVSTYIKNCFFYNINYPITIILNTYKINKNIPKLIVSYILAGIDYKKSQKKIIMHQADNLHNINHKILICKHPCYNYKIPSKIKEKYTILTSDNLKKSLALDYFKEYSFKVDIEFIKIIIGNIYYYYQAVNKIIIININNCKYQIKDYIKYLDIKIQKKIIIINI